MQDLQPQKVKMISIFDIPSGILFPAGMLDITRKVHTEVIDDILCKVYISLHIMSKARGYHVSIN